MSREHGENGQCPTCGSAGTWDFSHNPAGMGLAPEFEDWISTAHPSTGIDYECHYCWLK